MLNIKKHILLKALYSLESNGTSSKLFFIYLYRDGSFSIVFVYDTAVFVTEMALNSCNKLYRKQGNTEEKQQQNSALKI